ncbi:MAG: Gfo/Idh/MocA family oxidoreductase, partial [Alphaproteobacteria bacterium]
YGVADRVSDWRAVTEDPSIDVVSICSYDDGHAEQAVSAFRNGKHVMVEKPVALHRSELEALVRAWQDSGRLLTSNLILRRCPRFLELKARIDAGELGEVFAIEGDYLHDILEKLTEGWRGRLPFYCTIYGGGIHLIDLMRWLVGREVEAVAGMGNKVLTRDTRYKFDDSFMTLLRFEGGALGKCLTTLGPKRPKLHALSVFGTRGTFVNGVPDATLFHGDDPERAERVTAPYPGIDKGNHLPDFIAAIREGREPMVSGRDVVRVMDVCLTAREATEAGRTLVVDYTV